MQFTGNQRTRFGYALIALAIAAVVATGCGDLVTVETLPPTLASAPAPTATLPAPTAGPATEPPPESMPTAAPLWTNTPAPTAAPTVSAHEDAPTTAPTLATELPDSVVAMINGEAITRTDYDTQVQRASTYLLQQPNLDAKTEQGRAALTELNEQVINLMIDQRLIEQAAARQGIVVQQADIETQLSAMRGNDQTRFTAWLSANGMTEDDLREQIRMDAITAAIRDQVTASVSRDTTHLHVRHILLSEETRANEALARLKAGDNFIAIAREYSEDTATRESGGDLGFMPEGVMPPGFDEAAMDLEPGQISDLIISPAGFQIIQLVEIDPNRRVAERFWPQLQQRAFADWLAAERAQATLQIDLD